MNAAMRTSPATLSTLLGGAALALLGCSSSSADTPTDATTPPDDSGVADGGARDTAVGGDGGGLDAARTDADARSDGGGLDAKDIGGDGGDGGAVDCGPLSGHLVRARDFLDAWGVVFDPTSTDDLATTAKRLDEIGVRRLRAQLSITGLDPWKTLQAQMKSQHFARPRLHFEALVNAYNGEPGATPPSWTDQKGPLLDAARAGLLTAIEGPNEIGNPYVGHGSHGVEDTTDQTGNWAGPDGNLSHWATAIHAWKAGLSGADAAAMAGVQLVAPSIASGLHDDYRKLPDLTDRVDLGNLHFYAGNGLQPNVAFGADNPDVGYFANLYAWCRAGMTPTRPLVLSEYGASTPPGDQYSLHAQAAYVLNQMHDAAGIGAARFYVYTLFDPSTGSPGVEPNFGIFTTDKSDKPAAVALSNVKHLFSLGLDYAAPANESDTICFAPGYDGAVLRVDGIGESGHSSRVADAVVFPKSDGTTVISVTNEPTLSDGKGGDLTPAVVTATVHFGSAQTWHRYDVFGATPRVPVASGTGESVDVPLTGYPQYLLLDAPPGYHP